MTLREAAQQALEALGLWATGRDMDAVALNDLIFTLEAALGEPVQEPVAWRVRGYAQFKTGKPGPWRYFDGAGEPAVNTPDCCDFERLYTATPQRKENNNA